MVAEMCCWPSNRQRSGLRKDDIIELLIDAQALRADDDPLIRGMLLAALNAVEMLDEFGQYRSIARDVIVSTTCSNSLEDKCIEDDELLTFEKEDLKTSECS